MTAPQPYSGAYWRSRTDAQLEELADGNFRGGAAYDGALAEIARRGEAKRHSQQIFWTKLTFWTVAVIGVLGILATLGAALIKPG